MKIVMLEPLAVSNELIDELSSQLKDLGYDFDPCYAPIASDEEKIEKAKDADVLIIANSPLGANIINACDKLKFISVAFAGVDHVDAEACQKKGIVVSNAQNYSNHSVAELAVGHMLNLLRNIRECDVAAKAGKTKDGLVGNTLFKKTVGIVGTGAIGRQVAKVLQGFECDLIGYDVFESEEAKALGVKYMSLDDVMAKSDIVTLHTPLIPATTHMINAEKLALMKDSAILINCARGGVVDTQALADALNAGKIRSAGLDVYEGEPPLPTDHPLLTSKNTLNTPHVAFATKESMITRANITFENVVKWHNGEPQNVKIK